MKIDFCDIFLCYLVCNFIVILGVFGLLMLLKIDWVVIMYEIVCVMGESMKVKRVGWGRMGMNGIFYLFVKLKL